MNKAIIRVAKLKTIGNIAASGHHTFRTIPTPNADAERTALNVVYGSATTQDLLTAVRGRLPDKHRKDAVLCLEYLVTASPEHFGHDWRERKNYALPYFSDALEWLKAKHGAENVVCANVQLDEKTPHMAVYVVPRVPEGGLSAKRFTGGKAVMVKLQTDFAEEVGKKYGLERGIEGSKAKHTTVREYYGRINEAFEPLPEVETPPPPKVRPEPKKPGLFAGKGARKEHEMDHAKWAREHAAAERQREQRNKEMKAQVAAAVSTARRNEAQAKEAEILRAQVRQLKLKNSAAGREVTKLRTEVKVLEKKNGQFSTVLKLLKPAEWKALEARKRLQEAEQAKEAERAKQAEIAAQKAAKPVPEAKTAQELLTGLKKFRQPEVKRDDPEPDRPSPR